MITCSFRWWLFFLVIKQTITWMFSFLSSVQMELGYWSNFIQYCWPWYVWVGYCWIRFKFLQTIDPSFRLFSCAMDHFSKWWWFMQCNLQFNDFVPIRLRSIVHIVHSEQHKINFNICTSESSSSSESSDTVVAWGFLFSDFFLSLFWVGGLGVLFLKVFQ